MKNLQPLIDYYVGYFMTLGEPALKTICSLDIPVESLCMKYKTLEPMPTNQIDELRLYAKEMFPLKSDSEIEKIMKAVYTIGTLA